MTPVSAREVLGPGSPLERALAGYERREGQLEMAESVERALDRDRALFIEAGTGTGKTLAYLVPAVLSGKKIVISTATRTLQDQIFSKDLPLLREVLGAHGITFTCALMKGLSNYLCRRRYEEAQVSGDAVPGMASVARWLLATETGDRAELTDLAESAPVWQAVQSGSDTRIGATCSHYDACFVTRMKRDAERADIIIVNHHLYCADLALKRGDGGEYASVIPPHDAVIFDEAHKLEDIATDFFGVRLSSSRVQSLARDAKRSIGLRAALGGSFAEVLDSLSANGTRLFEALARGERPGVRRALSRQDLASVEDAAGGLDAALARLAATGGAQSDESSRQIGRRADAVRSDLAFVTGLTKYDPEDVDRRPPAVAWLDVRERSAAIGASAIDLGPVFRECLFERVPAAVFTSATLATRGSGSGKSTAIGFFRERLGAPADADEAIVASPFDFAARCGLYVSVDLPEPGAADFEAAAALRIAELVAVSGGGALVLCTSNRSKDGLFSRLGAMNLGLPLFVQGSEPKHRLLSRFRAARDGVLVATLSLWEGVDVPGEALRMVIIDKIPFAVPTDPVVMARCEAIDRAGGSSFAKYSIPTAAITLKQGFGRLIRARSDAGVVALLDKRAVTKGYGKPLLASLPPARRLGSLDEVRAFWTEVVTARPQLSVPASAPPAPRTMFLFEDD